MKYQINEFLITVEELTSEGQDHLRTSMKSYSAGAENASLLSICRLTMIRPDKTSQQCLLSADGWFSQGEKSVIVDGAVLLVCCGNSLFSLKVENLDVNWMSKVDDFSAFGVYSTRDGYIVHGELEITSVDKNGNTIWKFSGADLFTRPDGRSDLIVGEATIETWDFQGNHYRLGYNGLSLKDSQTS